MNAAMPDVTQRAQMHRLATLAVLGAIFCISGASALIYQVAWQRILVFHSGAGIYSISVIVEKENPAQGLDGV